MKKTLTINLGGTMFHIDEDAYNLLENYLNNLRLHFGKEPGANEIVDDMEQHISELFTERITAGSRVITLAIVEEIILRMGKPEEMEANEGEALDTTPFEKEKKIHRRLYRDPNNRILGGIAGGLAHYLGWDVTLIRLLLVVIFIAGFGTIFPIYLICWLIIPEARTVAEQLSMRGEVVTMESIGKSMTGGFEQVVDDVNDYMGSSKPRTLLQRIGNILVTLIEWILKIGLVLFVFVCCPVLFVIGLFFVTLLFVAIMVLVNGGTTFFSQIMDLFELNSPWPMIGISLVGILMVGIPLFGLLWTIFSKLFKWRRMVAWLKWSLVLLWILSVALFCLCFFIQGTALYLG